MAKTWLITGTSTGFGHELAELLAQQSDVNLVATARNTDKLDYLDQYDHGQILKLELDVTKPEQIKEGVKQSLDKFGTIDVLDNNAGLGYFSTFEEADEQAVRYMFEVNVWGLSHMTQAVLPVMRQQNSGVILGVSSDAGLIGEASLSFYSGTKFAVEGLFESLAEEVKEDNIQVTLLEPSSFRTDWAGRSSQKKNTAFPKDYQVTDRALRTYTGLAGDEPGDPKAAAQLIYDQVTNHMDELPLHLPLGESAVRRAQYKFSDLADKFEQLTNLAAATDFSKGE
ncbi:SDR family NAD(P)-dependent oxidoreductase [Ligilactobacillus pobuzihii]|uniref:Short chain dehydrogenase n=2 Tax=Ligilactobacillus pobuzihii TaxID=449659 RepID=A0A0R2LHV7_9LACO|nr:SDR family NAD(P)-dependent oxidoreductase [Ligilactobacillus pobuzihii]KRN98439.1 short chain dehydrogenase [Ligilactobacillus pobuzihii]GEN49309.1 short-chain dehydrogenase/reductase [Ligilactobacillus pobuzihii]